MRRKRLLVPAVLLVVSGIPLATTPAVSAAAAPPSGLVTIIQAVPDAAVDVSVDGTSIASGAAVGDVLGPFALTPGEHEISFDGSGLYVGSTLTVVAEASQDVVLHLPAEVGGEPVVHSYTAPDGPIAQGKARLLLAHTATVAPADVEVDGQTVFTNIANGEYADADVPAGTIRVALLPSGSLGGPILGPLDVSLTGGTLSMIYAYGNPRNGSMNVISHTTPLAPDGSVRPTSIDTGSAGLVDEPVETFGADEPAVASRIAVLAGSALNGALVVAVSRRGERPRRAAPPTP